VAQRQINVRLDEDEFAKFETASFIEGRTLPEELRNAVRAHLPSIEGNSYFQDALAAREGRQAERGEEMSKVSSLEEKRTRTRRTNA
jgi:hypothetical protein